jgi:hypothetical protein
MTQLSFCSSLSRQGTNLVATGSTYRLPSTIFRTDWHKWNTKHVSNFIQCHSSVFEENFLHPFRTFACSACRYMFQVFGIFSRGHTTSELGKPIKNLCSSQSLLSRRYLQCFRSFCNTYPQFRATVNANTLLLAVCHFLCTPQSHVEQHTMTYYYPTIIHTTVLFRKGNGLAGYSN